MRLGPYKPAYGFLQDNTHSALRQRSFFAATPHVPQATSQATEQKTQRNVLSLCHQRLSLLSNASTSLTPAEGSLVGRYESGRYASKVQHLYQRAALQLDSGMGWCTAGTDYNRHCCWHTMLQRCTCQPQRRQQVRVKEGSASDAVQPGATYECTGLLMQ